MARRADGETVGLDRRFSRGGMIVRVAELEDFLGARKASKLSDQTPFLAVWRANACQHMSCSFCIPSGP